MRSYDSSYPAMYVYIQEQMHVVANDPSKWAKDVQRKTNRFESIVRTLIEQGIEAGAIRGDIDARVAVKALFGMLNWTHRWYRPGGNGRPGGRDVQPHLLRRGARVTTLPS